MANLLSDRINQLSESETIAMARMSRELTEKGYDIVNLSLGEPDFGTPEFIKDAAKLAIDQDYSKYTPVPGYVDLRKAIASKLLRDNGLKYSAEQIVVSTGAKQSIANAVLCLVNPGDEVIIPAPYWVSYREIVKMAGGTAVYINSDVKTDFKITAKQLEKAITPRTKLMIFSSPCNPTGSVYTHEELAGFAKVIAAHQQMMVIADEIYELIVFEGKNSSLASFPEVYNQTITINGLSKGFAMTGWRLGYMAAPQWLADACNKMQGQFTSGTCSITQRAAITAMQANPAVIDDMKMVFQERRDLVYSLFSAIPGLKCNKPQGAFYLFPDVSAFLEKKFNGKVIETASDLSMYLLEQGHVATVGGEAFGAPSNIRLSYATATERLKTAAERIASALAKLQ
jgi:aspartate aminotransferase